jgi:hypothetical protein
MVIFTISNPEQRNAKCGTNGEHKIIKIITLNVIVNSGVKEFWKRM